MKTTPAETHAYKRLGIIANLGTYSSLLSITFTFSDLIFFVSILLIKAA
jgi:hypothetical protein